MTEWLRVNVFTLIRQRCSGVIPTESQRQRVLIVSGKGLILRVSLQNISATRKYHQEVQLMILQRRPAPEKEKETQRSNIMDGFTEITWQLQDSYHPGGRHSGQLQPLRHVHTWSSIPGLVSGHIMWVGCSGCFWFLSGDTGKNQQRSAWRPPAGAQESPDVSGLWCWITYCRKDFFETFIICFIDKK